MVSNAFHNCSVQLRLPSMASPGSYVSMSKLAVGVSAVCTHAGRHRSLFAAGKLLLSAALIALGLSTTLACVWPKGR